MNNFPNKIAIIGIGLIGGSIAMGLKQHFGTKICILGNCHTLSRSRKAKKEGIIDEIFDINKPDNAVKFYIIATPILQVPNILNKLALQIKTGGVIMDVGSTKEFIIHAAMNIITPNITFIASHPMAGSEMSGFENANPNLFRNKPWIVCTKKHHLISELIEILGAEMILMDAKIHDEYISWASHLNLVSASILTNTIGRQKNWTEVAKIASTGFRDTTRLASSNVEMKKDIIITNKENVIVSLTKFQKEIELFINILKSNDRSQIAPYLFNAKTIRDNWIDKYFS